MFPNEVECFIAYEKLKEEAKVPKFSFDESYKNHLESLQKHLPLEDVGLYFPTKKSASSCISAIRSKIKKDQPAVKKIEHLMISEDLTYITVDNQRQIFKKYDNEDNCNRIIMFFSDLGN